MSTGPDDMHDRILKDGSNSIPYTLYLIIIKFQLLRERIEVEYCLSWANL